MPATLRSVLSTAATLAVVLVSFEGATRVSDWVRFGVPIGSSAAMEEDLLTIDAQGEHGRPHSQFQKWALNNMGMRGPDVAVKKTAGVLRVVTAGASETFGLYETPEHEYPRQLEDTLSRTLRRDQCTDTQVEVVNAAIFGMSLPTIDQDLRTRVALLDPDIVVLYPTPVQYLEDSVPRAAMPSSHHRAGADPWYRSLRPRVVVELRNQLKDLLPNWVKTLIRRRDIESVVADEGPAWRFSTVPTDRLARYDEELRHVIGTIRRIGATPVIMTHANLFMPAGSVDSTLLIAWERFYPRATGSVIVAFDSQAVATTLEAARDSAVVTVDLADSVRAMRASDARRLFGDYAHFTDRGSAFVASALAPAVLAAVHARVTCRERGSVVMTASRR